MGYELTTGDSEMDKFDVPTFIRKGIKVEPAERITKDKSRIIKECIRKLELIKYMHNGIITPEEADRLSKDERYLAGLKPTFGLY